MKKAKSLDNSSGYARGDFTSLGKYGKINLKPQARTTQRVCQDIFDYKKKKNTTEIKNIHLKMNCSKSDLFSVACV